MIAILTTLFGRPWNLRTMLKNYEDNNAGHSEMFFALNDDDKTLDEQVKILEDNGYKKDENYFIFSNIKDVCDKFYYFYPKVKHLKNAVHQPRYFDAYLGGSDDVEFSKDFDKELIEMMEFWHKKTGHKLGVYYGDDGIKGQFQATHWMATSEFLDVLGYFSPLGYMNHCFLDNLYMNLATAIGALYYCPHIKMIHNCPLNGKIEPDDNWKKTYNKEYFEHDQKEYARWLTEHGQGKVYQLTEALKKAISE